MKKDLLYNFLLISLIIHLLLVLPGIADFGHPKIQEKEPLSVEITGPVYAAPKTLPQPAQNDEPGPITAKPQDPSPEIASANKPAPVSPEPVIPSPETVQTAQQEPAPPTVPATEGRTEDGLNGSSPAESQGISACTRSLSKPNQADLMRFAKAREALNRNNLIDSYLTMLSSLMDRRKDILHNYSGSRINDPSIEFTIISGELYSIEIVRSSGNEELDNAVKQVLVEASPFTPMPAIWKNRNISFVATINIY